LGIGGFGSSGYWDVYVVEGSVTWS